MWQEKEENTLCSRWKDRLTLTASSSQIDFPASALPRSSTALSSWTVQVRSMLVMDCFSWCFLLLLLPTCFSPNLEFLTGFGRADHPWRASPVLVGAVRGFLGWQLSGYQGFLGRAQLAASGSLLLSVLPAFISQGNFHPRLHRARARTDKNQVREPGLPLAAQCLCLPAWEQRQDPITGIPGAGSLACFGCQLPSMAFQKHLRVQGANRQRLHVV